MTKDKQFVKIFWQDAVIYKDYCKNLSLVKKITIGEMIKENKNFVIIKNPTTSVYVKEKKMYLPFADSAKLTFFFIPKGMINKIKKLMYANTC